MRHSEGVVHVRSQVKKALWHSIHILLFLHSGLVVTNTSTGQSWVTRSAHSPWVHKWHLEEHYFIGGWQAAQHPNKSRQHVKLQSYHLSHHHRSIHYKYLRQSTCSFFVCSLFRLLLLLSDRIAIMPCQQSKYRQPSTNMWAHKHLHADILLQHSQLFCTAAFERVRNNFLLLRELTLSTFIAR